MAHPASCKEVDSHDALKDRCRSRTQKAAYHNNLVIGWLDGRLEH